MTNTVLHDDWFPRPLPANVALGEGSWLYSAYAFLHYRSTRSCGLRVGCHTGIYIGSIFDIGPAGEVEIGSYCTLAGPIISTNGVVKIGDYALISGEVVLADHFAATPGDARTGPSAPIVLGECSWVGSRAVLLGGADIGEGAIIGAGAVVDFAVPPFAIVAGNPARVVGSAPPRRRGGD